LGGKTPNNSKGGQISEGRGGGLAWLGEGGKWVNRKRKKRMED